MNTTDVRYNLLTFITAGGPAKVRSHGFGDQGKAVVDRSPRTDLADAQARDEQPQAGPCRPLVCMGPSTHAVPSQQPEAFARSSVGALVSIRSSLDLVHGTRSTVFGGQRSLPRGDHGSVGLSVCGLNVSEVYHRDPRAHRDYRV
jgi:hypothetical protein